MEHQSLTDLRHGRTPQLNVVHVDVLFNDKCEPVYKTRLSKVPDNVRVRRSLKIEDPTTNSPRSSLKSDLHLSTLQHNQEAQLQSQYSHHESANGNTSYITLPRRRQHHNDERQQHKYQQCDTAPIHSKATRPTSLFPCNTLGHQRPMKMHLDNLKSNAAESLNYNDYKYTNPIAFQHGSDTCLANIHTRDRRPQHYRQQRLYGYETNGFPNLSQSNEHFNRRPVSYHGVSNLLEGNNNHSRPSCGIMTESQDWRDIPGNMTQSCSVIHPSGWHEHQIHQQPPVAKPSINGKSLNCTKTLPTRKQAPGFRSRSSDCINLMSAQYHQPEVQGRVKEVLMHAEQDGSFGFGIRRDRDVDQLYRPIRVERVLPGSPADISGLLEGDIIQTINDQSVHNLSESQVVKVIQRESARNHDQIKVLVTVKPPEHNHLSSWIPDVNVDACEWLAVEESMSALGQRLESGEEISEFRQLFQSNPNMAYKRAVLDENTSKNRYYNVLPYDDTRVVLKSNSSGDYVNANFISMAIPGTDTVNRYIASQGPLENTVEDFWHMVWQENVSLIIMLTELVENGMLKCDCYWPELYNCLNVGRLDITCVQEDEDQGLAQRQIIITDTESKESRVLTHLQYKSWPDHGVPEDSSEFIQFITRRVAQQHQIDKRGTTLVHCSAGIGRTGVFILMETALSYLNASQPVIPLQMLVTMREQRALLIQTTEQYTFVCQAILRVFEEMQNRRSLLASSF